KAQPAKQDEKPRPRMIVYTARLEMVVEDEDFDSARERILELLKEQGGYVASSDQAGQLGQPRQGTWVLRVPVARFDAFLDAVAKVGELQRQALESDAITDRYFDTRAEGTNLEGREKALRKLYDEKIAGTKLSDLLEVDRELSNVRAQINQRKGQLQRWEKETTFATVNVHLFARKGYVPPTAPDFGTSLSRT